MAPHNGDWRACEKMIRKTRTGSCIGMMRSVAPPTLNPHSPPSEGHYTTTLDSLVKFKREAGNCRRPVSSICMACSTLQGCHLSSCAGHLANSRPQSGPCDRCLKPATAFRFNSVNVAVFEAMWIYAPEGRPANIREKGLYPQLIPSRLCVWDGRFLQRW